MTIPKFVLADNTDYPDDIYVIHLEYPLFIINLSDDTIEFLEDLDESEEAELTEAMEKLIEEAGAFYDREMDRYDEE
ncbi:MAG: hypothetical protein CFE24_09490 [Flavobacterium sp. BFFFF2]|jgi:hypothetical protein|nr:MAG: hypothetical protein CFE24_09490 [Flavobacterium sp. BFFFF2]